MCDVFCLGLGAASPWLSRQGDIIAVFLTRIDRRRCDAAATGRRLFQRASRASGVSRGEASCSFSSAKRAHHKASVAPASVAVELTKQSVRTAPTAEAADPAAASSAVTAAATVAAAVALSDVTPARPREQRAWA